MSRRTIAFLTLIAPPGPPQGVAAYSQALAAALSASEFDIAIWAQGPRDRPPGAGHPDGIILVWRPGILAGLDLFRRLRRSRPDLMHVQFEFGIYGGGLGLVSVLSALALARLFLRQRVIVTLHQVPSSRDLTTPWLRRSGIRLPSWSARWIVGSVITVLRWSSDRLIVHAGVFRDRLQNEWGVRHGVVVLPHGVAVNAEPDRSPVEDNADARRLLIFGYLKWYKGIEIALEAFRRLAPEFPEWTLTIAGPAASDVYRAALQTLARPLGRRVEFLGPVEEDRIGDLYRQSSVVLLPYRTLFSASGPLAQAIGHATPFVISEELRPLCPSWPYWARSDPAEWTRVLRPLMHGGAARAAARGLAVALARELEWPIVAELTCGIYRGVVS